MIVIDMDMPKNCLSCKYKYVCSVYENIGVLEQTKLKLDKQRHPKCPIKCDIEDIKARADGLLNDSDSALYQHGVLDVLEIIDKYTKGDNDADSN